MTKVPSAQRLAELSLFTAGVAFGAQTPIGRELGVWLKEPTIVAVRFVFALPFCFVGFVRAKRVMDRGIAHLLPLALLFPISCTLFTYAFFNASIAVAIFGFFSVVAIASIAFGQSGGSGKDNLLGFLLAAASGLCNTAIAQEQKRVSRAFDAELITLAQVVGGIVFSVCAALVVRDHSITHLSGTGYALGLLYGFLFFACGRLMVLGFRHGPIGLGSVLLSIEVIVGPLLAYVFFNQSVSTLELVGGACTAVAVIFTAKRAAPSPELEAPLP